MSIFRECVEMGYKHVIPMGYDHILFILALFFFNSKLKTAVIQCSVFTVAHSLTLALVSCGFFNINTAFIESVIALSIFFVAFENTISKKLNPWRLVLVFIFGLIHGVGFASALNEFGIPRQEFVPALLGFNLGVELAQVSIILFCYFLIAKWSMDKPWYRNRLVIPVSLGISCIGLFWTIERFLSN